MPQQGPPEYIRVVFFIFVLFWFLSAPDTSALISDPESHSSRREQQDAALALINGTKWGDFAPLLDAADNTTTNTPKYLNLIGFREEDGFAWQDLESFKTRCHDITNNAKLVREGEDAGSILVEPIWQNASGLVHGPWVRNEGSAPRFPESYNLSAIAPEVEWIGKDNGEWSRNMTGREGSMMLKLDDADTVKELELLSPEGEIVTGGKVRTISAIFSVEDTTGSGATWDLTMYGVHWVREGTIMMTTTSAKYAGVFGLPHLAPRPELFEPSRQLLNRSIWEAIDEKLAYTGDSILTEYSTSLQDTSDPWRAVPHCEYVAYLQIHSIPAHKLGLAEIGVGSTGVASIIEEIERELANPTGIPIPKIPSYQLSGVLYSPDCGYFLETKGAPVFTSGNHLTGFKEDMFYWNIDLFFYTIALVLFGQLVLMKNQVQASFTPSTMGRISFYTLVMMAFADGMVFTSATALSLSTSRAFLPCLVAVFPCIILTLVEGNFLSDIYKAQEPERRKRFQEQQANSNGNNSNNTNSGNESTAAVTPAAPEESRDSLPRPVTAPPPAPRTPPSPPIIIPSDQDIDAEIEQLANAPPVRPIPNSANRTPAPPPEYEDTPFGTIMGRCVLASTFVLFFSVAASSWYPTLRSLYTNLILFIYLSMWVPQIYRNIMRNCRRALSWPFMVGHSVLRLIPIAYFYLYADNIIFCRTEPTTFAALVGWVWVQLWVLGFQDVLGPRFGVPKSWAPEAWDYHPVLREDGLEAGGLPIGLSSAPGSPTLDRTRTGDDGREGREGRRKTRIKTIDCAICCEDIEVPVMRTGEEDGALSGGGVAGVLARRSYMVTPCRHIFHGRCLEGWMRFRLQCPICREELPPL